MSCINLKVGDITIVVNLPENVREFDITVEFPEDMEISLEGACSCDCIKNVENACAAKPENKAKVVPVKVPAGARRSFVDELPREVKVVRVPYGMHPIEAILGLVQSESFSAAQAPVPDSAVEDDVSPEPDEASGAIGDVALKILARQYADAGYETFKNILGTFLTESELQAMWKGIQDAKENLT